ncbi:L-lactate dehydrogenase [Rothia sp. AR01]|uniref:L-lactate dehydrogenase n=1 Tax=Rothia santali TaxID=2949643 RepID=A0A9X2KHB3_9MICC|nr:L-lactate dehydrogenase [Rothia santali]MCP3424554.1 L-lactate dehydrogenase [Rothia santali]
MTTAADRPSTKLGIVGAGGVGSAMAYAALIRGSAREVVLYDIAAQRAEAEALDIAHGSMFASGTRVTGGGDLEMLRGSDMIVITAGAKQRPGQPRLELAEANVRILEAMLPGLMEQAPDAVYMLVTNPCDVLTVVAQKISGLPSSRILSSGTVLDSSRLRWLISREADVAPSSVHSMIIGEHGDSEFPLWSQANIGQVPVDRWTGPGGEALFTEERKAELAERAMRAAYQVIEGKGSTNYAIGLSGARIAEAVLHGQDAVLPVSTVLDGYHGISGIALSVPSVVGFGGIRTVLEVPMDEREERLLHASAEALSASLSTLGH